MWLSPEPRVSYRSILTASVYGHRKMASPRWATPCSIATTNLLPSAEGEVHAGKILEVVLVAGVAGAVHAEAGVEVVHLNRPKLDVGGQSVVQSATELHRECVVIAAGAGKSVNVVKGIGVRIAVRRTEQGLSERLELARVLLDLRAKHVGEHVALHVVGEWNIVVDQLILQPAPLGVAHEVGLDANPRSDVVNESAAATKNVEAGDLAKVRVNIHERKTYRNFKLRYVLCDRSYGEQQRYCDENQPLLHVLTLLELKFTRPAVPLPPGPRST